MPENYEELYCFFGGVFCLELRVLAIFVGGAVFFYIGRYVDEWHPHYGRELLGVAFWALLAGFLVYWFLRWVGTPVMLMVGY